MEPIFQKTILLALLWIAALGPMILMNKKLKQGKPLEGSLDRLSPYLAMASITIVTFFAAYTNPSASVPQANPNQPAALNTNNLTFSNAITEGRWADVPIVTHLRKKGLDLSFIGREAGGLPGFYGSDGAASHTVYYITPDGRHAIAGLAFDADGKVITAQQLEKIAGNLESTNTQASPPEDRNEAHAIWSELEQANWIALGDTTQRPIYMIADPACPHCARAWGELEDAVQRNEIHVRVIPVSLINGSNPAIVHEIFNATDPASAWVTAINAKSEGRRAPRFEGRASQVLQNMLHKNHRFFAEWNLTQVPQFFFLEEEEDGLALRKHIGLLNANALDTASK